MAERVCPWWLGYLLASPIRRWISDDPEKLLTPFVREGMTVLEPGPGMGFFSLPLARMVGPTGRVITVDIQPKMLTALERKLRKAGLDDRVQTRLAKPESMGLDNLQGAVDFALAFAVVHEMPSIEGFFRQTAATLKPGALLFFAEPAGHVTGEKFQHELEAAHAAGLAEVSRTPVRRSLASVLRKA